MSIESALVTHLKANVALAALVSTRIYPMPLPESPTLPAVTYIRVGYAPTQTRSATNPDHGRQWLQLDVWATTRTSALAVVVALRAAMALFQQSSSPRVDVSLLKEHRDMVDADTGQFRSILEYDIWHTEA